MTETLIGVDQRTAHIAGLVAVVAVLATAMVVEPELQARGYGAVAIAIYAVALPVLIWSLVEDIRRFRN